MIDRPHPLFLSLTGSTSSGVTMGDPHEHHKNDTEKEYEKERDEAADPLSETIVPANDEDIDEEKEIAEAAAEQVDDLDEIESIREQEREIAQMKSHASGTSVASAPADAAAGAAKRRWYGRLNPLRWGSVPPVPRRAHGVSRDRGRLHQQDGLPLAGPPDDGACDILVPRCCRRGVT